VWHVTHTCTASGTTTPACTRGRGAARPQRNVSRGIDAPRTADRLLFTRKRPAADTDDDDDARDAQEDRDRKTLGSAHGRDTRGAVQHHCAAPRSAFAAGATPPRSFRRRGNGALAAEDRGGGSLRCGRRAQGARRQARLISAPREPLCLPARTIVPTTRSIADRVRYAGRRGRTGVRGALLTTRARASASGTSGAAGGVVARGS